MTRGFGARIGRRISAGWLVAVLSLLAACATLPDVKPFTDATVSLRSAVASGGAATVAELGRVESPGVKVEADKLAKAWEERDKLFTALIAYDNETTANQQSAASIRLEKARKVVESTTAAVSAMTDLKNELDKAIDAGAADADIKQLAKQVGTVIEKLQDVRTNVEAIR